MPSSKVKAKNAAAHQHDKRHESGLAAPGRRVIRQRSHNNLHANGTANGKPASPADSAQQANSSIATSIDHHVEQSRPQEPLRVAARTNLLSRSREEGENGRDRTVSDASNDGMYYQHGDEDGQQDDVAYYMPGEVSRRTDHNTSTTGTLAAVSTILTYYPLRDAISILILLLSLPATLVLVIQALFASLTFVPPTASISLPSIKEMLNAQSLGYPALATILFVDLLIYLCWLPLWRPVQNVLLDLSQAVVAVSLSGAAASTGGPTYSIATCSALVCVVHVLRYKAIHLTALDYLRSVLGKTDLGINLSVPFTANQFFNNIHPSEHSWIYSTIRTILGIHIVSQGLMTCIRRSLASQNEKPATAPVLLRADTEAAVGHDSPSTRVNTGLDSATAISTPPNGASSLARDGRARESGRRRRKQAIEIRGNQPLWAAIASTKVTFVKEMEQRDAADDAKETTSMEKFVHSGTLSAKQPTNRVWVSSIHDTEVSLCAELQPADHATTRVNSPRAFYVRVNGAVWNSTKASSKCQSGKPEHISLDIFGLTPRTSYQCGIFATETNQFLCAVSFVTQLAVAAEQVAPIPPPVAVQALRPSSPATTLRRSIEQASASLAETKNRSKKSRKDQRAAYSDIRKEIKELRSKLENGGGNDDKQSKRLQQFTQHKNQADEAALQITKQIEELGDMPAEDVSASDVSKQQWQLASGKRSMAQQGFDDMRSEADREARELKEQIGAAENKRERLKTRHQQRKDELASVAAKHQAEITARQKHDLERAARRDEQEQLEAQLRFHIASMNNETDMHNAKAMEAYQQGQALQGGWGDHFNDGSTPPTPDQARHAGNLIPHALSNGLYGTEQFDVPYAQHQQTHAPRGRSSSLLSNFSDFEDIEDGTIRVRPESTWPMQKTGFGTAIVDVRKESEASSGSSGTNGSTASSSPKPDVLARPFVPSRMSPIAPPARKTASPQTNGPPLRLSER